MSDVTFQFDPNQKFQLDAIDATVSLFDGQPRSGDAGGALSLEVGGGTGAGLYQHALGLGNRMTISREQVLENLRKVQDRQGLMPDHALIPDGPVDDQAFRKDFRGASAPLNFTVSMETGTGKTYVYLRTMRELHAQYGWSKFFIVVPSVAIREGVKQSLRDTDKHLRALYHGEPMDFFVYDGKKPTELAAFARNSCLSVCIINIQAFIKDIDIDHSEEEAKRSGNVIYKPQEDLQGKAPIEFVRKCNPIVIIDEPQSVDNTAKAKAAIRRLNPMMTLRYSATHREPYNLVYDLGPVEARRKELVKGIVVTSVREGGLPTGAVIKCVRVGYKGRAKTPSADVELLVLDAKGVPKLKKKTVKGGEELELVSNGNAVYADTRIDGISVDSGVEVSIHGQTHHFTQGQGVGQVDEHVLKAMVVKTVEKHLLKEKQLSERLAIGKDTAFTSGGGGDDRDKRIKVLSLIFLDKVADYRRYDKADGDGKAPPGKVSRWIDEALDKYRTEARFAGLPALSHANDKLHDGYFAQDKKGHAKDTSGKTKADESAYELIMQNKGKLLDPAEPLRIVVSHSALREGWDNPNVFQICKLGGAQTEIRRRQELGRGLRLPVDASGVRIRDQVINELTVIGAEDYASFAKGLQSEFQSECGVAFGVVLPRAFAELETNDGPIGFETARTLHQELKDAGLLDAENQLVEDPDFRGMPGKLSAPFRPFCTEIEKILLEHKIEHHVRPDKPRTKLKLNRTILDHPAFTTMWDKVSRRTRYRLELNSEKLIGDAAASLKSHFVTHDISRQVQTTTSDLKVSAKGVTAGRVRENRSERVDLAERLPDPLGYLSARIDLSRQSLSRILNDSGTFGEFAKHPARYLEDCTRLIRHTLASELVAGVTYEPIEGSCYEQRALSELDGKEVHHSLDRIVTLDVEDGEPLRSLTQPVAVDSGVEYTFAQDMQNRADVLCFAKLPAGFKVPTPVGDYNPDWVIIKKDSQDEPRLYLVRENKDTLAEETLREGERHKIRCARKHFEALGVDYAVCVTSDQV